jgi:hypothetical protein
MCENLLGRGIEVLRKETSSPASLQPAESTRAMVGKICQPVLDVRRIRTWFNEGELDHVTALKQTSLTVAHITALDCVMIANGSDPTQACSRVGFGRETGHADPTAHPGHSQ